MLVLELGFAHAVLDGNAGKVRDFLPQAGQAIEKGGLAGIRRADNSDNNGPVGGRPRRQNGGIR
jgi:hypothetical protein